MNVYRVTDGNLFHLDEMSSNGSIKSEYVGTCLEAYNAIKGKFPEREVDYNWEWYCGFLPGTQTRYIIVVPGRYDGGFVVCPTPLPWLETLRP